MLNGKRLKIIAGFFLAGLLANYPMASAAFDYHYDARRDLEGQYEATSSEKMARGVTNALFGWTEIGRTPAQMAAGIEHGALTAFFLGVPYGVFRTVGRTMVGCYEVATFFAPQSPIMTNLEGPVA